MNQLAKVFILFLAYATALADPLTIICTYDLSASPDGLQSESHFVLTFIVDEKNAYMLGNAGTSEVQMLVHEDFYNFIETSETGNIMLTTVTRDGDSVHSRNSVIFGALIPSQYYGRCEYK